MHVFKVSACNLCLVNHNNNNGNHRNVEKFMFGDKIHVAVLLLHCMYMYVKLISGCTTVIQFTLLLSLTFTAPRCLGDKICLGDPVKAWILFYPRCR